MFEITIKEIKTVTKLVRGEHTVIDERPYTDDELSDCGMYRAAGKDGETKRVYGYAPDREEDVKIDREIFSQTVEDLDLPAVIKAINKI